MATFQNKSFTGETITVDGNRYVACSFTNCNLIYQGGDLPTFDRCIFRGTPVELEGAAYQTLKYLNQLYRGGLAAPVETVLNQVQSGGREVAPPPALYTGTNFGRLGAIAAVMIIVTVLLATAIWYGSLYYPETIALEAEPAQPLSAQIPLDVMPALPDSLAAEYDALRDEQATRLDRAGWVDPDQRIVRVPLDVAFEVMVAQGAPTWAAAAGE